MEVDDSNSDGSKAEETTAPPPDKRTRMSTPRTTPEVYLRGILDSEEAFRKVFQVDPSAENYVFRFLDTLPFKVDNSQLLSLTSVSAMYIFCNARVHKIVQETGRHLQEYTALKWTIGETMAPYLPSHLFLTEAAAKGVFIDTVNHLMNTPALVNKIVVPGFNGIFLKETEKKGLLADSGITTFPFATSYKTTNLNHAVNMLLLVAQNSKKDYRSIRATIVLSALIAFAKRGSYTEEWISRVLPELETEAQATLDLSSAQLSSIFRTFGRYLDNKSVADIFKNWTNYIPVDAIRTRAMLEQAKHSGLTAYYTIMEALVMYEDFPWIKAKALIKEDFTHFAMAMKTIQNDAFSGYNSNMGNVVSRRYRSLAYVAKELLIKIGGKKGLRNYRGWTTAPQFKRTLDELIQVYESAKAATSQALKVTTVDEIAEAKTLWTNRPEIIKCQHHRPQKFYPFQELLSS